MTIRVSAELFKLASGAVSEDAYRYYLNGVRVEPHPIKGALLVATDGHRMIVVHDEDASCDEDAIVSLPKFALSLCKPPRAGKSLGVERKMIDVDAESGVATIVHEFLSKDGVVTKTSPIVTTHSAIVLGTYPDWRKVVPSGKLIGAGLSGFNPRLLASLAKFGEAFVGHSKGGMYFLRTEGAGEGDAVLIRWGAVRHVCAVLMPFRTDFECALPGFLSDDPVPAIAAE